MVLLKFSLRLESGGQGRYRGGDGVDRQILFRRPLTLSILTERRVHQPYGLQGGGSGECGKNLLKRVDGRMINLGGRCSVTMQAGVSVGAIRERNRKVLLCDLGYVHFTDSWRWCLRQKRRLQ